MSDRARLSLTVSGAVLFGTLVAVAAIRPIVVLALLASALIVGALAVLVAAAAAVLPEVARALVDDVRTRHRAGVARLRADAMRRHPAGRTAP